MSFSLNFIYSAWKFIIFTCLQLLAPPYSEFALNFLGNLVLRRREDGVFIGDFLSKLWLGRRHELLIGADAFFDGHAE